MLKEPITLATRRFASPPRRNILPRNVNSSPSKGPARNPSGSTESNKVLAALDALQIGADEDEADIEILGPFPAPIPSKRTNSEVGVKGKGKEKTRLQKLKPELAPKTNERQIHSFFLSMTSSVSVPSSSSSGSLSTSFNRPTVIKSNKSSDATRHATPNDVTFDELVGVLYDIPVPPIEQAPDTLVEEVPEEATDVSIPATESTIYSYKDYTPKPILVYTRHGEEADDLIGTLKAGPVALDMEWRVFFTRSAGKVKSSERKTAVVQVADTNGVILVIQVHGMGRFPKKLQELIESPDVPKMGVNILNDGKKLFRDYGILASNLVELGAFALVADPEGSMFGTRKRKIVSLAKLVDRYCGKTLAKGDERVGNWEAELDSIQLAYAANDAHSSLMVYNQLLAIAKKNDVDIGNGAEESYTSCVTAPSDPTPLLPSSSTSSESHPHVQPPVTMRPQHLRAYQSWHHHDMTMEKMCVELSLKPVGYGVTREGGDERLKPATVISYIISALQANPKLHYDTEKLRKLVQTDAGSWTRHREWILQNWHPKTAIAT